MDIIFTKKLLHLIDKIINLSDIDIICKYISEAFKDEIPHSDMDIVIMDCNVRLFSEYILSKPKIIINNEFALNCDEISLKKVILQKKPCIINDYGEYYKQNPQSTMNKFILNESIRSSLLIPITNNETSVGALIFSEVHPNVYDESHILISTLLADCLSIAITKLILIDDITLTCICGFAHLVESKDDNSGKHVQRVQEYSKILATKLSENDKYKKIIDSKFIENIYNASTLHDIGKVGIPDGILLKQGKLSREEFEVMKKHTLIGANVLKEASSKLVGKSKVFFDMAIQIVMLHHEKYDGSGYPNGLSGNDIPVAARIVAVADVLDALTSLRPYKLPLDLKSSINIIKNESGKHFDPVIVDTLLLCKDKIAQVYESYENN